MELRTERLVLRPVAVGDLETLLSIRNAPEVIGTTATGEPLPRETMAGQLGRRLATWREHGFGSWLILHEDDVVGFVEIAPYGENDEGVDPAELEVGVIVRPDHWGRGVAPEAGLAAAADLFDRLGLERVYAGVDPGNDRSLRALAKAAGVRRVSDELYELPASALTG